MHFGIFSKSKIKKTTENGNFMKPVENQAQSYSIQIQFHSWTEMALSSVLRSTLRTLADRIVEKCLFVHFLMLGWHFLCQGLFRWLGALTWLWLSFDWTLTWLWIDFDLTLTWLWLDSDLTLTWPWLDPDLTLTWPWLDPDLTLSWPWLDFDQP